MNNKCKCEPRSSVFVYTYDRHFGACLHHTIDLLHHTKDVYSIFCLVVIVKLKYGV